MVMLSGLLVIISVKLEQQSAPLISMSGVFDPAYFTNVVKALVVREKRVRFAPE